MNVFKRVKIVIEPVLILIISFALMTYLYNFYVLLNENTEIGNERHLTESTLKNAAFVRQKINSDLDTILMVSNYISTFEDINGSEAQEAINRISKDLPFSILLISKLGESYISSNNASLNLKDPEFFLGSSNQTKNVTKVYKNALYGRDMLALSSPIYQNGTIVGSVSGLYYTDYIKNVLVDAINENNFFQIAEKNGDFILLSDSSYYLGHKNLFELLGQSNMLGEYTYDNLMKDIQSGNIGFSHFQYKEKELYLSYAPIGINDWYLITFSQNEGLMLRAGDIKDSSLQLVERILALFFILIAYIVWRQFKYKKVMVQSNTNLEILNKQLKYEAENDLLTGLLNRVTSENEITEFLETEGKEGRHALFALDVDDFKRINDQIGHLNGDLVLEKTAEGIMHGFRSSDIKGRVGGDEFIVLLKDIQSEDDIKKKADDIVSIFKGIKLNDENQAKVTGSVGASIYPDHGTTYQELFKKADIAMYYSKDHGKDGYHIYSNDLE